MRRQAPKRPWCSTRAARCSAAVANAIRVSSASPRMLQPLFGFLLSLCRAEITDVLDAKTKALLILKTLMENGCKY